MLKNGSINEFRSPVHHPYLVPFLRALKPTDPAHEECYPLAAIKFGIGYLIPSGLTLSTENWFEILLTAISNLSQSIASKGTRLVELD